VIHVRKIGHSYRVGFTTVGQIVIEVYEAIIKHMAPIYIPKPTEEIWTKSEQGFFEKWQFPNCIGSVDGKHVTIKCHNNSEFLLFKKIFSRINGNCGPRL